MPTCLFLRLRRTSSASTTHYASLCPFSFCQVQLTTRDSSNWRRHRTRSYNWSQSTTCHSWRCSAQTLTLFSSTFVALFCLRPSLDDFLWYLWRCWASSHPTLGVWSWWCNLAQDWAMVNPRWASRASFPCDSSQHILAAIAEPPLWSLPAKAFTPPLPVPAQNFWRP